MLRRLSSGAEPLVVELPRGAGQKETRWAHLIGDPPSIQPVVSAPVVVATGSRELGERVARLEEQIGALNEKLGELLARLGE